MARLHRYGIAGRRDAADPPAVALPPAVLRTSSSHRAPTTAVLAVNESVWAAPSRSTTVRSRESSCSVFSPTASRIRSWCRRSLARGDGRAGRRGRSSGGGVACSRASSGRGHGGDGTFVGPRRSATTRSDRGGSIDTFRPTTDDLEAVHAVADAHDERHVVLDDQHRGAELAADLLDQRAERFGLALGDPGGRLVEAQHAVEREQARELDDPPRPGGEIGDAVVRVAPETEKADEVVGLGASPPPLRMARGAGTARSTGTPFRPRASSATSTVSRTVQLREQLCGLEACVQILTGAARRPMAVTSTPWRRTVPWTTARSRRSRS